MNEPEVTVINPPLPEPNVRLLSVVTTELPDVMPVTDQSAFVISRDTWYVLAVPPLATLHDRANVTDVPFGTVNELSKLYVVFEPEVNELITLDPVLSCVVPFHIAQPVRSVDGDDVMMTGIDDRRISSPDCVASSW